MVILQQHKLPHSNANKQTNKGGSEGSEVKKRVEVNSLFHCPNDRELDSTQILGWRWGSEKTEVNDRMCTGTG